MKSVYSSTQQQCTSYSTSKYGTSAAQVQHKYTTTTTTFYAPGTFAVALTSSSST